MIWFDLPAYCFGDNVTLRVPTAAPQRSTTDDTIRGSPTSRAGRRPAAAAGAIHCSAVRRKQTLVDVAKVRPVTCCPPTYDTPAARLRQLRSVTPQLGSPVHTVQDKKLCRCRGTARRGLSVVTTKGTLTFAEGHWYCHSIGHV